MDQKIHINVGDLPSTIQETVLNEEFAQIKKNIIENNGNATILAYHIPEKGCFNVHTYGDADNIIRIAVNAIAEICNNMKKGNDIAALVFGLHAMRLIQYCLDGAESYIGEEWEALNDFIIMISEKLIDIDKRRSKNEE